MQTSESNAFAGTASGFTAGQTSVPQRTTPSISPRPDPSRPGRARWLIAAAAIVAVTLVGGIVWSTTGSNSTTASTSVTAQPTSSSATGPGCPIPIPAGASPTAVAYVHALDMARPRWAAVSTKLYAENRHPHLSDMAPQAAADTIFLTYLRRIQFPTADVTTANGLMNAVAAYRNLLLSYEKDWSLFDQQTAQRQHITDIRSAASARLRALLGLPVSTCGYWRP